MKKLKNTKLGRALIKAVDRNPSRAHAEVTCNQSDFDEFNELVKWSAKAKVEGKDSYPKPTIVYIGRRFYFNVDDEVKNIKVEWI